MASTINGTSTGNGGLISTGDDSGILNIQTNETTAITVDASQNVGIGGTATNEGGYSRCLQVTGATEAALELKTGSSYSYLAQNGTTLQIRNNATSGVMTFATEATERMRIDSSGNLLVGTTSAGGSRMVVNGATGGTAVLAAVNSTGSGNQFGISSSLGSTANNTNSAHFQGGTAGAGNWYLFGNGTNGFTSDQRLKKNIETTRDGYLADVCRLRVVKYNWKNDAEGTDKELGLIAQEVEQVFPKLVQDDLNKISPDDDTIYKTLKGSVIPFMLLKAIQELKTINDTQAETINALTARIVALETK